ncbi:MAG: transglutaminase-like domain-containing protein, partial [Acidaminobacteraceae bacterium]
ILNSSTYIPAKFISDTFDLNYKYNKSDKTLTLDFVKNSVKFSFIEDDYFKRIPFDDMGVYISIPQLWEKSENSNTRYEYSENDVYTSIDISSSTLTNSQTIESFIKKLKTYESDKYSTNINYTGSYEDTINGLNTKVISSIIKNKSKEIKFLIKEGNKVYILAFKYSLNAPEAETIDTINLIAKSFQISNFTVNYDDEHYIEYDAMYKNNFKIDQEIFSNQEIKGLIPFSGSVSNDNSISGIRVSVSKLANTKQFIIPVENGKFNGNIYAPFGLGKHDVLIEVVWKDENKIMKINPKILELSIINLKIDKLIYLMPSEKVQKDDVQITSLSSLLTYEKLRKFDKAKALFDWITENISVKQSYTFSNPKNSIAVFDDAYGNNLEINILYTALLRSIGVPSRLVLGSNIEGASYYYTELFLNGEWSASDPVAAIRVKNSESLNGASSYFLSSSDDFKRNFDRVEILDR